MTISTDYLFSIYSFHITGEVSNNQKEEEIVVTYANNDRIKSIKV